MSTELAAAARTNKFWIRWLVPVLLLLLFWTVSLRHLALLPPVNGDEPWQASTGWKLASAGLFGTDLFGGWFGMDRHYYGYMPVHPLFLALVYWLAGVGLWQTRFEAAVMGLVTLALTYALGRRLAGPKVGALSGILLLVTRTAGVTRFALTGILLFDVAGIARYDIVAPVFGLAALQAYLTAIQAAPRSGWYFAMAGGLAALAGLSHLYGAFWLPVLIGLAIWQGAGWRNVGALAAGFALPALLYGLYVLAGFSDWQGQFAVYGDRFDLTNPAWYWNNLLLERKRYGPGLGAVGWQYLARPGFWGALVAAPAATLALAGRAIRHKHRLSQTLLLPVVVLPILYALLLAQKTASYLMMIVTLASVAVAWAASRLWDWSGGAGPNGRTLRLVMVAALVAVSAEGVSRVWVREQAAQTTTSYAAFTARIRQSVRPGDRLLALHDYWLGLTDVDFVSWWVPIQVADTQGWPAEMAIDAALDRLAPDVVVLDGAMLETFDLATAADSRPKQVWGWLERRGFKLLAVVDDDTYGHLQIYRQPTTP